MNKYLQHLEKTAALGDVGKALIRNKLGPAIGKMSPGGVSKLEALSRAAAGSPIRSGIFSKGEIANHMNSMAAVGKKMLPSSGGVAADATNKLTAVAARATRMGILKSAGVVSRYLSRLSGGEGRLLSRMADDASFNQVGAKGSAEVARLINRPLAEAESRGAENAFRHTNTQLRLEKQKADTATHQTRKNTAQVIGGAAGLGGVSGVIVHGYKNSKNKRRNK